MACHPSLRTRYPYMFQGQHVGLTIFRGWSPILARACEQIDGMLVPERLGFHWVQLRSDQGAGFFLYLLGENRHFVVDLNGKTRRAMMVAAYDVANDLTIAIDQVVIEAERVAGTACMVCGARAEPTLHFGQELTLCACHAADDLNERGEEGLEGFWREAVEWEASSNQGHSFTADPSL